MPEPGPDPGDAEAQFRRGLRCASAASEVLDYAQAADWYLKAAMQNHSLAQYNLGVMYARGQGVLRDDAKSALWIRRAAQSGDAGAQHCLGMNHHRASLRELPEPARESRIEAYKWFQLAAAQGYQGSETACGLVILSMSREDVIDGNRRVGVHTADRRDQIQLPGFRPTGAQDGISRPPEEP
jgi:TPR repeat protein